MYETFRFDVHIVGSMERLDEQHHRGIDIYEEMNHHHNNFFQILFLDGVVFYAKMLL